MDHRRYEIERELRALLESARSRIRAQFSGEDRKVVDEFARSFDVVRKRD